MSVEFYLCDPAGVRFSYLDYLVDYEYALIANSIGLARVRMPAKFNRGYVRLDNVLEIWRKHKFEFCGFLRAWSYGDIDGVEYTDLYFLSPNYLLSGRIVEDYATDTKADMNDYADDMIKAIATDQLGGDADADRDLTSVGGGVTISGDLSAGETVAKAFAYRNVLEVCQEIASTSAQAGTRVYFEVVPVIDSAVTGELAFRLDTFTGQRGMDRSETSNNPVFIGREWGNLVNARVDHDHIDEIDYSYVLGQGDEATRELVEVSDTARIGESIWNRREGYKDARHVEYGNTDALTAEGNAHLDEYKPKFAFVGDVVETPSFLYGIHWGFGDLVTAIYADIQVDALINKVMIRCDVTGQETITAELEVVS